MFPGSATKHTEDEKKTQMSLQGFTVHGGLGMQGTDLPSSGQHPGV